ncbi:methyltransferase domain-containing protein, partial [Candidatus Poribacteria bacterium]|nr:methyltransferase domain-containing protein [Candidatus Poribacteria bacterium]
GQGRHSVILSQMGLKVIGIDSSTTLLDIAKQEMTSIDGKKPCLLEGDMREIPLKDKSCDAVINLFTSFGFFEDTDNIKVLKSVCSILKPGGKFLLDYWNPFVAAQLDGTRNWWWITENLLALAEAKFDFSTGRLQDVRTLVDIGKSSVEKAVREVRFYSLPELEEMMEEAGLQIIDVYGDIDGREYDGDSRQLITISTPNG